MSKRVPHILTIIIFALVQFNTFGRAVVWYEAAKIPVLVAAAVASVALAAITIATKKLPIKVWALLAIMSVLGIATFVCAKNTTLLYMVPVAFAALANTIDSYAKNDLIAKAAVLALILACFAFGATSAPSIVRNSGFVRQSFGFSHPNLFGYFIATAFVDIAILLRAKKRLVETVIAGIILCVALYFADSRAAIAVIIAVLGGFVIGGQMEKINSKVVVLLSVIPAILLVASAAFTGLYVTNNRLAVTIDSITSGRLDLQSHAEQAYEITPFGQAIETTWHPLDNGYYMGLYGFGVLGLMMVMGVYCLAIDRMAQRKEYIILGILIILAVYALMESRPLVIAVTPIVMCFLCQADATAGKRKRVAIVTINDKRNLGNRLQNYAVQETLKNIMPDATIETLRNTNRKGRGENLPSSFKAMLRDLKYFSRTQNFSRFNNKISFSENIYDSSSDNSSLDKDYDFFVVGSDQVWNPNYGWLNSIDLLSFAAPSKRVSFAASFGVSKIASSREREVAKELEKFKAISVREKAGEELVRKLTGRKDVQVLVDPTVLLSAEEWGKLAEKPKALKSDRPIILLYFLGGLSEKKRQIINDFADKNGCQVIDIFDKKSSFYACGPAEFLYLEKAAMLICTDSFHSSVFAIINERPFLVFDREGKDEKMNSRLDTLLRRFGLEDRWFDSDEITSERVSVDYSGAKPIIETEKKKAIAFIKAALEVGDED